MRILRAADRVPQPWRNGAGWTQEVAREADGADPGWRVSIAIIDRDAPFSRFVRYARTLVVLDGGSIALAGEGWERLLAAGDSVAFSGDEAVHVRIAAPARVLNVMTRTPLSHVVQPAFAPLTLTAGEMALALGDRTEADGTPLARYDAAIGPGGIAGSGRLLAIRIGLQ